MSFIMKRDPKGYLFSYGYNVGTLKWESLCAAGLHECPCDECVKEFPTCEKYRLKDPKGDYLNYNAKGQTFCDYYEETKSFRKICLCFVCSNLEHIPCDHVTWGEAKTWWDVRIKKSYGKKVCECGMGADSPAHSKWCPLKPIKDREFEQKLLVQELKKEKNPARVRRYFLEHKIGEIAAIEILEDIFCDKTYAEAYFRNSDVRAYR